MASRQQTPPPQTITLTLKTQDPATTLNQLFTLKTKQAKIIHHLAFLDTTTQNNLIPLGFQIKLTPQVMDAPKTDITQTWDAILVDTSKELMKITQIHYTSLLASINKDIEHLESLLDKLTVSAEQKTLTPAQEERITQLTEKLEHTRTKKVTHLKNPPGDNQHTQTR